MTLRYRDCAMLDRVKGHMQATHARLPPLAKRSASWPSGTARPVRSAKFEHYLLIVSVCRVPIGSEASAAQAARREAIETPLALDVDFVPS